MKAVSLHSRDVLLQELRGRAPQLACDYMLEIDCSQVGGDSKLLLTNFNLPDVGVTFSNNQVMGHVSPNVAFGSTLQVSFIIYADDTKSPIHKIWESQFIKGVPKFIPYPQLPVVTISKIVSEVGNRADKANNVLTRVASGSSLYDLINSFYTTESEGLAKNPVMVLRGCRFSFPKPGIEYASDGVAVYTTTITFESFEIS